MKLRINARKRKRMNVLRVDPTRTLMLRKRFQTELRKRFARIRYEVVKLVVEEDAFGLGPQSFSFNQAGGKDGLASPVVCNSSPPVLNQRWSFQTTPEKVRAFRDWLRQQLRSQLHGRSEEELWTRYVEEGFRKGAGRAFDDVRRTDVRRADDTDVGRALRQGGRDEFLRSAFGRPVAVEKVKLLVGRTLDDLEGVTDQMARAMTRTLADGLVQGKSPREIARDLVVPVDSYRGRALAIARTEIIHAHATGQLEALEQLGVEEVGVMVEWSTAGDDKVCELCSPLEGLVVKIEEAQGMIPRHPNCRCAWVPANVGESKEDQIRGKSRIDRAIERSAEGDDTWAGADASISRRRPQSILDNSLIDFSRFLREAHGNGDG